MTRREKLLAKARANPGGLRFQELETLLAQCGWIRKRQTGSHVVWLSPGNVALPIQPASGGKAKAYQVRQFLALLEDEHR
jgi:predicted RNA binding protein YcfA (HicA-like mRNA interferase family)